MIIDKRLQVSSQQALTATAVSTDVVDTGAARDVGPGDQLWLCVAVRVAPGGTSPTLAIGISTDDNSGFSSETVLFTGPTLAAAAFPLGARFAYPVPFGAERYLRAKYTMGGTSPTVTLDAFFTNQEPVSWVAQADGL